jgi:hypothetical protein
VLRFIFFSACCCGAANIIIHLNHPKGVYVDPFTISSSSYGGTMCNVVCGPNISHKKSQTPKVNGSVGQSFDTTVGDSYSHSYHHLIAR